MTKRIVLGLAALLLIALGVAIYRFNAGPGEKALTGQTRADLVRSASESCIARQKAAPENASVPAETIGAFCACYAEALAKRVTESEVDRLNGASTGDIQTALREKMVDAESVCLDRLDDDAAEPDAAPPQPK